MVKKITNNFPDDFITNPLKLDLFQILTTLVNFGLPELHNSDYKLSKFNSFGFHGNKGFEDFVLS